MTNYNKNNKKGQSEYSSSFGELKMSKSYGNGATSTEMFIKDTQLRDHKLREEKYKAANLNLGVTGNTEVRVRFTSQPSVNKKIPLTRKDFACNPCLNNNLPFEGRTEYMDKYAETTRDNCQLKTNLSINPTFDLRSASYGRQLATNGKGDALDQTVYAQTHTWPGNENENYSIGLSYKTSFVYLFFFFSSIFSFRIDNLFEIIFFNKV